MGGDLGDGPPKFEVGTAHASVPSNILRSVVIGCEAKYKLTKKCQGRIFCSEVKALVKKRVIYVIYIYIYKISGSRDREKTDKIESRTKKRFSEILGLKMESFS